MKGKKIIYKGKRACPNCGSFDVERIEKKAEKSWFWFFLDLLSPDPEKFECKKCGCIWKEQADK